MAADCPECGTSNSVVKSREVECEEDVDEYEYRCLSCDAKFFKRK